LAATTVIVVFQVLASARNSTAVKVMLPQSSDTQESLSKPWVLREILQETLFIPISGQESEFPLNKNKPLGDRLRAGIAWDLACNAKGVPLASRNREVGVPAVRGGVTIGEAAYNGPENINIIKYRLLV